MDYTKFKEGDWVIYPAHGVGCIQKIEKMPFDGQVLVFFRIVFEQERLRVCIPVEKATKAGMRKLSDKKQIKEALKVIKGRAQKSRALWNQKTAAYEEKIYSGQITHVAEVLRDLKRNRDICTSSYSENALFEEAYKRLSKEISLVEKISSQAACEKLDKSLSVG